MAESVGQAIIEALRGRFTIAGQKQFLKKAHSVVRAINQRARKKGYALVDRDRAVLELAKCVTRPCRYCGEMVTVRLMSLDHPVPIVRGGDPTVVEGCCLPCNQKKGDLKDSEYRVLLRDLMGYPKEARAYILRSLGAAGFLWKMRKAMMAKGGAKNAGHSDHQRGRVLGNPGGHGDAQRLFS